MNHLSLLLVVSSMGQPTAAELEKAVLASRRSIQSGVVVLKVNRVEANPRVPGPATEEWRLWFDVQNGQQRCDLTQDRAYGAPKPAEVFSIQGVNCEERGRYVSYANFDTPTTRSALTYGKVVAETASELPHLVDVRLLGLFSSPYRRLRASHFQSWLENPARNPPAVFADNWKEKICWRLEFSSRSGVQYKFWIVPEWGHSVVKVTTELRDGVKITQATSESEIKQFGTVWFPWRTSYEQKIDGVVTVTETVMVTEAQFNAGIPPVAFTLKGMNLREGLVINCPDRTPAIYWWEDGKMVLPDPKQTPPMKAEPVNPPSPAGFYWYLGGGALCAATLALYVHQRRKGESTETGSRA